jgi:hypothetical protein
VSAKICGLTWDLDLPREEKYVLLCLADHADHDGNDVFPSVALIAWKTQYSERRVQQFMRRLEERGILVKVKEQFGRGRTMKYRIDLKAGTLRERRKKGETAISPIREQSKSGKGEIPQGERVKSGALKGERAIAPESINRGEPSKKELPLPPLSEGENYPIWQKLSKRLKEDLSTAFVNNSRFHDCAYDKYFRDSWLVEIRNGVAILDSTDPVLLHEGVVKFQKRLRDAFQGDGYEIHSIRVRERSRNADTATRQCVSGNRQFERSEAESVHP